jgi:hypothetical protein
MIEKHIQKVNVNPFLGGLILKAFFKGYNNSKCSLLMMYLVLPAILYSDTREILSKLTTKNSLQAAIKVNKVAFIGFQERVWAMRKLTHLSLINLDSKKDISFGAMIQVINALDYSKYEEDIRNYLKAAHYLGVLFAKEDIENIFKHLKVIP